MIYLTKEWWQLLKSSCIINNIRENKYADQADEKKIERLYQQKKQKYVENERKAIRYINNDESNINKVIEAYLSRPNITAEEIKLCVLLQKELVAEKPIRFEADTAEKWFEIEYEEYMETCEKLPREILDEITDLRMFCLGYATKATKDKVRAYCREKKKEVEKIEAKAKTETKRVEDTLSNQINFLYYKDTPLVNLEMKEKDLYIDLVDRRRLIVRNVNFIEREEDIYYRWNESEYASPWTYVIESELHYNNGRYEVHFLMENRNEIGEKKSWYLTLSGTTIEVGD